jgi:hypothetical protein
MEGQSSHRRAVRAALLRLRRATSGFAASRRRPFLSVASLFAVAAMVLGVVTPISLGVGVSAAGAAEFDCGTGSPSYFSFGNCAPTNVNFEQQGNVNLSNYPVCGIEGSYAPLATGAVDAHDDDPLGLGSTTEGNYTDSEAFQFQANSGTELQPGDQVTVSLPQPAEPYSPSGSILPPAQVGSGETPEQTGSSVTAGPVISGSPEASFVEVALSGLGTGVKVRLDAFNPYNPPNLSNAPGGNVSGNTGAGINGYDSSNGLYDLNNTTTTLSGGFAYFKVTDGNAETVVVAATDTTNDVGISQTATLSFNNPTAPSNPDCDAAQLAAPSGTAGDGFTYVLIVNNVGYLIPAVSVTSASGVESATLTIPVGVPATTNQVTLDVLDAVSPPGQGTPSNALPSPNTPYPPDAFSVTTSGDPVPGYPNNAPVFQADANNSSTKFFYYPVDPFNSTLIPSNSSAVVSTGVIDATATLTDQYNNTVNNTQVSIFSAGGHANVAPQTPPKGTAYPQTGPTGTVTYTVTDNCAETVNLQATDIDDNAPVLGPGPSYQLTRPVTFTAGPAAAPDAPTVPTTCGTPTVKSSINVNVNGTVSGPGVQASAPADGVTNALVTVTMGDQFGNVDSCQKVVLVSTSLHAVVTPLAPPNPVSNTTICPNANQPGYTGSDGVAQFDVTDATAEQVVLSIADTTLVSVWPSSPTLNPDDVAQIQFQGGDTNQSTLTASSSSAPGNGQPSDEITATINDGAGQPLQGKSVTLVGCTSDPNVSGSCVPDPTTTITALASKTNNQGHLQFEVSDDSSSLPHHVYYQATDASDGITIAQTLEITFTTGGASLSATPATVIADGIGTSTVTFALHDTSNNPVSGVSVTLAASDGTATISPSTGGTTGSNGAAQFTVSDTQAGSVTLTATGTYSSTAASCLGVFTSATSICTVKGLLAVTFVPAPYTFTVSASPATNIPADGSSPSLVTVTALDVHGNPIGGIPVSLTSTGTGVVTPTGGTDVTTGNGQVTFDVTDANPETVTLTAQYQELGSGGATESAPGCTGTQCSTTVAFVKTEAETSTVTANPSSAPADGKSAVTVVVTLLNGSLAAINGHSVVLTTGSATTTVTPSNVGGVSGVSPLPAGAVSFTVTDTHPETLAVYARDENTGAILDQMPTITFQPTEVQLASVVAVPTSLPAGGPPGSPDTSTVTVTLVAPICQGPGLSGHTVDLTTPSGTAVVSGPASTSAAGVATFTVSDPVVQSVVLTAVDTSCGVTLAQTATVVFTASEADQSTVSINPTSTAAEGPAATLSVTLETATGAPIVGRLVTVPTAPTNPGALHATVVPLVSSPGLAAGVTNSQGLAQFAVSDNTVETVTLDAFDGTTELDQTATINFTASEANQSTIVATATSIPAGSPAGTTVTVKLISAGGAPVVGDVVSLLASSGTAKVTPASEATNSSGVATFTVTDSKVETVTLTAVDRTTGVTLVGVATVTFAANEQNQSTITTSLAALKVKKSTTITVTLLSSSGTPVVGHVVTLATGSSTAKVTPLSGGKTNTAGQAQFAVTDSVAENLSIYATDTTASPPVTLYQPVSVVFTQA